MVTAVAILASIVLGTLVSAAIYRQVRAHVELRQTLSELESRHNAILDRLNAAADQLSAEGSPITITIEVESDAPARSFEWVIDEGLLAHTRWLAHEGAWLDADRDYERLAASWAFRLPRGIRWPENVISKWPEEIQFSGHGLHVARLDSY